MALKSSTTGRFKLTCAAMLAFGALTTASHAYTLEQQQMCSGDAMRLCSSEIPNVDRITACMERQRDYLSEGCRTVFEVETPAAATQAPASEATAAKPSRPINLVPKYRHG